MSSLKKAVAVLLTVPLWLPILSYIVVQYLIIDCLKTDKDLEEI
jgi:hypothetical protein